MYNIYCQQFDGSACFVYIIAKYRHFVNNRHSTCMSKLQPVCPRNGTYGLCIFAIVSKRGLFFTKLGEMTGADNVMYPPHFGSDSADTRIRMRFESRVTFGWCNHSSMGKCTWRRRRCALSVCSWMLLDAGCCRCSACVCASFWWWYRVGTMRSWHWSSLLPSTNTSNLKGGLALHFYLFSTVTNVTLYFILFTRDALYASALCATSILSVSPSVLFCLSHQRTVVKMDELIANLSRHQLSFQFIRTSIMT